MKYLERNSFFKEIKKNLPPLTLILAPEEEHKSLLEEIHSCCKNEKIPIKKILSENFEDKKFYQEVENIPLFSKQLILIVIGLEKLNKNQIQTISGYIEKRNHWTHLILIGASSFTHASFIKLCEKEGFFLLLKEQKSWEKEKELIAYVIQEAAKESIILQEETAKLFVKNCGHDRLILRNELAKMICFLEERNEITPHDIAQISARMPQETLWQMLDALFAKNVKEALSLGEQFLEEGTHLNTLLSFLRVQMQKDLQILSLYQAKGGGAIQEVFPYLKGRLLEKKIQQILSFGASFLKKGLILIEQADIKSKNSIAPVWILEELFIKFLCIDYEPYLTS